MPHLNAPTRTPGYRINHLTFVQQDHESGTIHLLCDCGRRHTLKVPGVFRQKAINAPASCGHPRSWAGNPLLIHPVRRISPETLHPSMAPTLETQVQTILDRLDAGKACPNMTKLLPKHLREEYISLLIDAIEKCTENPEETKHLHKFHQPLEDFTERHLMPKLWPSRSHGRKRNLRGWDHVAHPIPAPWLPTADPEGLGWENSYWVVLPSPAPFKYKKTSYNRDPVIPADPDYTQPLQPPGRLNSLYPRLGPQLAEKTAVRRLTALTGHTVSGLVKLPRGRPRLVENSAIPGAIHPPAPPKLHPTGRHVLVICQCPVCRLCPPGLASLAPVGLKPTSTPYPPPLPKWMQVSKMGKPGTPRGCPRSIRWEKGTLRKGVRSLLPDLPPTPDKS